MRLAVFVPTHFIVRLFTVSLPYTLSIVTYGSILLNECDDTL